MLLLIHCVDGFVKLSSFVPMAGVLDDDDEDVLINVNIIDDERAEKNVDNKKKKPDYKPYDEPEFDEYGMVGVVLEYFLSFFMYMGVTHWVSMDKN